MPNGTGTSTASRQPQVLVSQGEPPGEPPQKTGSAGGSPSQMDQSWPLEV